MKKQTKTISGRRFREFINRMGEEITAEASRILVSMQGNTITFDLSGATINITLTESEKGGQK